MSEFQSQGIILACPLYRRADLLPPLIGSIKNVIHELKELDVQILFIVDSPNDDELLTVLNGYLNVLQRDLKVNVIVNSENVGFLKSANIALGMGRQYRQDVVLLNSDVELFPGALREMKAVAYNDHMIGFVSPRSNNATICTTPVGTAFRGLSPRDCYSNFEQLKHRLSRVEYVPIAVGFCLYIKHAVIAEFGVFDEIYGMGYNEENDLIMRANRVGYRAVIANHAFVYHVGESSFSLLEAGRSSRELKNAEIFNARYPEYSRSIARYVSSPAYKALALLDGFVLDGRQKLHVGFDMRSLGSYHNGTFEAAFKIVEAFSKAESEFSISIISQKDAYDFHGFDRLQGVRWQAIDDQSPLAAIVRIGQPFREKDVKWLRHRAPVVVIFMLDTIAMDAMSLDENGLRRIWDLTLRTSDAIFFNSAYTARQFNLRFNIPQSTQQVVALHSTSVAEYGGTPVVRKSTQTDENYILIVGNDFRHKFVKETVEALLSKTKQKFVVLGIEGINTERVRYFRSGKIAEEQVRNLYQGAKVVVFPSHYEGFGFPILNAMASAKPILARRMPVYEEIRVHNGFRNNIHLYDTTSELADRLNDHLPNWAAEDCDVNEITWKDSSDLLRKTLAALCANQTRSDLHEKLLPFEAGDIDDGADRGLLRSLGKMTLELGKKLRRRGGKLFSSIFTDFHAVRVSPFFDEQYYRETYRDMRAMERGHAKHFCRYGWREGRNPGPLFDLEWYVEQNSDIRQRGINPLVHYLRDGFFERRPIRFVGSTKSIVLPTDH
ncbi:glycosyltransferase [Ensifer sp. 2TAB8]|uniref:glycosyltransferase n=1 Tax=Ensifer sp. 2TAB8 TaxID=3233006 RepID=UPI003F92C630